jgi:hypothetical protein
MAGTAEETDNAWWTKPTFIISAIAVILLIGTGIILFAFLGNNREPDAAPPAQPQTTAPTPAVTEPASGESVCGLDATGGTTLTSAPENVEWEFLGGIAAPKSTEHGPGVIDEKTGVRSCYSHTPEGALLSLAGRIAASGDPDLLLETTRALSIDGPGKEVSIQRIEERIGSGSTTAPPIQIEGFRVLSYSDEKATLEVVASADSGSELMYLTTSADMKWHEGDWHVMFEDDGSSGPVEGRVSDLSGYIPWGPSDGR